MGDGPFLIVVIRAKRGNAIVYNAKIVKYLINKQNDE